MGNESDAIDLAKMYVSKFFNEDTNRFSVSATFNDDEKSVHPKGWFIRLYPLENGIDYAVWIMPDENKVAVVRAGLWEDSEIIKEINEKEYFHRAIDILNLKSGDIEKAYISNNTNNTNNSDKMVDINIDLKNGSTYIVTLSYPSKELKSVDIIFN